MNKQTQRNATRIGGARASLICGTGLVLALLCGCGSGSREPVDTPFVQEGTSTAFKVESVLAPPRYGSSKQTVPGTYIVKGSYDVSALPFEQQQGNINFRLAASYDGDVNRPGVTDYEIPKGQLKGTFEFKVVVTKVHNPMWSTLDLAYLNTGVQHSALKVKPK